MNFWIRLLIYNLHDKSSRLVLLDMIVKTLSDTGKENRKLNPTHLYEAYTLYYWRKINYQRLQITKKVQIDLLEVVIYNLWKEEKSCIHHSDLVNII